jgi:hypothetical protein
MIIRSSAAARQWRRISLDGSGGLAWRRRRRTSDQLLNEVENYSIVKAIGNERDAVDRATGWARGKKSPKTTPKPFFFGNWYVTFTR